MLKFPPSWADRRDGRGDGAGPGRRARARVRRVREGRVPDVHERPVLDALSVSFGKGLEALAILVTLSKERKKESAASEPEESNFP